MSLKNNNLLIRIDLNIIFPLLITFLKVHINLKYIQILSKYINFKNHRKIDVSKSSIKVLVVSLSPFSSFFIRFHGFSQYYNCSKLMKLSLPIESLRQIAFILFSTIFLVFLKHILI